MDPLILTSLITSFASFAVSILTHIRYSRCGFCEVETKESDNRERARSDASQEPLLTSVSPRASPQSSPRQSPRTSPRSSPTMSRKSMTNKHS